MYVVVGDFNDTPQSPWIQPLMTSARLTDVVGKHRAVDDRWTYYWRSRNRVSQIDYFLGSKAFTKLVDDAVAADAARKPYIERKGVAYRELNASGLVLPKESNLIHFEADSVTPTPANATPSSKIPFRFSRYPELYTNWKNNISDHCPVKVWF